MALYLQLLLAMLLTKASAWTVPALSHNSVAVHRMHNCAPPLMMGKKTSWSIGHSRKKSKRKVEKLEAVSRGGGAGFGPAAPKTSSAAPTKLLDTPRPPPPPPSSPAADDEEAMQAWREYCKAAMEAAAVEERKAGGAAQRQFLTLLEAED
jgi:hypothetical protein